jgi:hypothetical protein
MMGKSFMVTILACTLAGAFVGSLLADEADWRRLQEQGWGSTWEKRYSLPNDQERSKAVDQEITKAVSRLPSEEAHAFSQILTGLRSISPYRCCRTFANRLAV